MGDRETNARPGDGPKGPASPGPDRFEELYSSLYRMAEKRMAGQPQGHTLQPTALVNEVYLRLGRQGEAGYKDEDHFLTTAARAMRQVLVDYARRKGAVKRSGSAQREPLDSVVIEYFDRSGDIEALNEALEELESFDVQMARALELRFFAGQGMDEIARILGVKKRTLERRWAVTRAWLFDQVR